MHVKSSLENFTKKINILPTWVTCIPSFLKIEGYCPIGSKPTSPKAIFL